MCLSLGFPKNRSETRTWPQVLYLGEVQGAGARGWAKEDLAGGRAVTVRMYERVICGQREFSPPEPSVAPCGMHLQIAPWGGGRWAIWTPAPGTLLHQFPAWGCP